MELKLIGEKIEDLMKQKSVSIQELAKKLNIKTSDLTLKLRGEKEFLASEASDIANIFDLTVQEFANIFFNSEVSKNEKEKAIKN